MQDGTVSIPGVSHTAFYAGRRSTLRLLNLGHTKVVTQCSTHSNLFLVAFLISQCCVGVLHRPCEDQTDDEEGLEGTSLW